MRDENTFTGTFDNERTSCASAFTEPLTPRRAFLAAFNRLAAVAEAAAGPALAIAAVDARARVIDASFVPEGAALVTGRHTSCGLRLEREAVALRQIALLARREGSKLQAHVWDLNTAQPFSTEDGAKTAAVVADGPLYLAMNEYALWIVPVAALASLPDRAKEAWEALPPRKFIDRRTAGAPPPSWEWTAPVPAPRRIVDEITHVTQCAPPLLLGEDSGPEIGWGTLRLQSGTEKVRHRVSAERLERGLLIGRYERCGLTIASLDRISRVHLLVVRIGEEVWAIDTASTNGVVRRGQSVTALALEAEDELVLAKALSVGWKREFHPDA